MPRKLLTLSQAISVSMGSLLLGVILGNLMTLHVKQIGPNQTVPKSMAPSSSHDAFWRGSLLVLHVGRLEVLFIEQKSLREQLTEILQEDDDYTWTDEGLANFSIKISRKGTGLETAYSILPKVRAVPAKIKTQWEKEKESIWLPNFFEGKDPFDGKQTDEKGLPAGGTDARGSTVLPKKAKEKVIDDNEF